MLYIWLAVMIAAIAVEFWRRRAFVVWLAPAALVSLILQLCTVEPYIQIIVFVLIAFVGMLAIRPLFVRSEKPLVTNIDAIIGERGVVVERVENIAGSGQVRVHGQYWSARSVSDDCDYEPGDAVHVVAVEGVTLICKK